MSTTQFPTNRASGSLEIYLLGCVEFESALLLQEKLVADVGRRTDGLGSLILCEHPPIVTVGREGHYGDVLCEQAELDFRQMKIRRLNRGGSTLVHAPGQLAIYPILPLNRLGINLSEFRRKLLNSAIQACSEIRVPAYSREDAPGLWCRTGQFGYIGAAVKSWVSYHGMFLNVNPNLDLLRMVNSNPVEHRPTSLTAQKTRKTSMHSVRENMARQLASEFQYKNCHYYSGHPLLSRTRRKVYVNA